MTVEPESPQEAKQPLSRTCAEQLTDPEVFLDQRNPAIIVVISVTTIGNVLLLVITTLVCAVVYYHKRKLRQSLEESDTAVVIVTIHDHKVVLQSNACYHRADEEHRSSHPLEPYYSQPYVIHSSGELKNVEIDEELYWQPAVEEEDLKHQLKNLKVDEILKESIV